MPLTSTHLLYLATTAGAAWALGLEGLLGDLSAGKRFDALWLRPPPGSPLDVGLRYADGPEQALARAFSMGVSSDVACVWVDGVRIKPDGMT